MATHTTPKLSLVKHTTRLRLLGLNFIVTCAMLVLATGAVAQEAKSKPTLVPGSQVNLAAVSKVDWFKEKDQQLLNRERSTCSSVGPLGAVLVSR